MPSPHSVPRLSSSSPSTPEAASLPPFPGEAAVSVLLAKFADIPDPRASGGILHPLPEVLLCALFAVISNCDSYTAMATFAETQLSWLRRYIPLLRGAPSHDTFRYVFMLLQPAAIMDILSQWAGSLDGLHVRIDGKVSRGAKDTETGRSRLWLLRAWVSGAGLSVAQAACGEKSNELATLPALLASLQLKGALVTIDAMAGHPEIARLLHEGGAGYILALKANEKETHTLVAAHFKHLSGQKEHPPEGMEEATELFAPEIMPSHWAAPCDVSMTTEMNRGRWEERQVIAIAVGDWLPKAFLWYGLRSAVCVLRRTMRQRQSAAAPAWEVHYYLSSLPPEAAKLGPPIRAHWGVENSCHYLLDVTFREDHSQVRDAAAAQSLSLLREMAGALLRKHPLKGTIKGKRQRAALSQTFRAEVVAANFDNLHA
jgi:predicted transposase YbfD/YdcC